MELRLVTMIYSKPAFVCCGVGGNTEESLQAFSQLYSLLPDFFRKLQVSSMYQTEPIGYTDQADFINWVFCGETIIPPLELLQKLQDIEILFGRERKIPNGPRSIDIDILLYNSLQIDSHTLTIPHPRMTQRAFVLTPLLELFPNLIHPVSGQAFSQYLPALSDQGIYSMGIYPYNLDTHGTTQSGIV
jgi:2-amino-4-hydroxy-6-hydroxymethyldihydropteridine diphosphokinase